MADSRWLAALLVVSACGGAAPRGDSDERAPGRPLAPALASPLPAATRCSRGFLPDDRHFGLDLVAPPGSPVLASAPGVVVRASPHRDYGLLVMVRHLGLYTLYAHLSEIDVAVGDEIAAGAVLGVIGETGNATGVHLHWEVLETDRAIPSEGPLGIPGDDHRIDPAPLASVPPSCRHIFRAAINPE